MLVRFYVGICWCAVAALALAIGSPFFGPRGPGAEFAQSAQAASGDHARRWGAATPPQQVSNPPFPFPSFEELVHGAQAPAYGLDGHPMGLRLRELSAGSDGVTLGFNDGNPDSSQTQLQIESYPPGTNLIDPFRSATELLDLGFNPYHFLFAQLQHGAVEHDYPTGVAQETPLAVTIGGQDFSGRLEVWQDSGPFAVFTLVGPESLLQGGSLGIEPDALVSLLQRLVVLQGHPEVVDQYQAEFTATLTRGLPPAAPPTTASRLPDRLPLAPHGVAARSRPVRFRFAGSPAFFGSGDAGPEIAEAEAEALQADPTALEPGGLTMKNDSDHWGLLIDESRPFNRRFSLTVPAGLVPQILEATNVDCVSDTGRPNVVLCVMGADDAVLGFTAVPSDASGDQPP